MSDRWPRFDPSRGYWLCENCWSNHHYPQYSHVEVIKGHRALNCGTICQCPCTDATPSPRRKKPRPGDQMGLPAATPLVIGPKS